jgi:hypothetical protein
MLKLRYLTVEVSEGVIGINDGNTEGSRYELEIPKSVMETLSVYVGVCTDVEEGRIW